MRWVLVIVFRARCRERVLFSSVMGRRRHGVSCFIMKAFGTSTIYGVKRTDEEREARLREDSDSCLIQKKTKELE